MVGSKVQSIVGCGPGLGTLCKDIAKRISSCKYPENAGH